VSKLGTTPPKKFKKTPQNGTVKMMVFLFWREGFVFGFHSVRIFVNNIYKIT
jgi:hypothetical protein